MLVEWNEGHMQKAMTECYRKEWKSTGYREDTVTHDANVCFEWSCKSVCRLDAFLDEEALVPLFISQKIYQSLTVHIGR